MCGCLFPMPRPRPRRRRRPHRPNRPHRRPRQPCRLNTTPYRRGSNDARRRRRGLPPRTIFPLPMHLPPSVPRRGRVAAGPHDRRGSISRCRQSPISEPTMPRAQRLSSLHGRLRYSRHRNTHLSRPSTPPRSSPRHRNRPRHRSNLRSRYGRPPPIRGSGTPRRRRRCSTRHPLPPNGFRSNSLPSNSLRSRHRPPEGHPPRSGRRQSRKPPPRHSDPCHHTTRSHPPLRPNRRPRRSVPASRTRSRRTPHRQAQHRQARNRLTRCR